MWGPRVDDDFLANPAKIAMFDMPEHWDAKTDPHPNTTLANRFADFGTKYFNIDPTGGTGFAAIPETYTPGKDVPRNSDYTPPSQKVNNQGLLSNVSTLESQRTMADVSNTSSISPKIAPVSKKTTSTTWPQTGSSLASSLDSIAEGNLQQGSPFTTDVLKATTQGYLQGRHDVGPDTDKAASTFMGDLAYPQLRKLGKTMVEHGTDVAAHDSDTNYNLHYSQNPVGYSDWVTKSMGDSLESWTTTDDEYHRRNIEKNADNAAKAFKKGKSGLAHTTSKVALGLNGLLTDAEDKMPTAVEVAHEVRRNRWERENAMGDMMTHRDIRTDTAEHLASDTEEYLSQTLIGTHFVNLAKVYAYRGKPFMMSNAVDMFDKSFDVWADNIIEKGDHSYLNALMQTIRDDHPSTNDILVNLISNMIGGSGGDSVLFLWDSMKDADKNEMMKQVKERQKGKLGIAEPKK